MAVEIKLTARESDLFKLSKKLFPYREAQIIRALNLIAEVSLYSDIGELMMRYTSKSFPHFSSAADIPLAPFTAE